MSDITDEMIAAAAARLRVWQPSLTLPMSSSAENIVRDLLDAALAGRVVVDLPEAHPPVDIHDSEYQVSIIPRDDINRSPWSLTVAYRGEGRYAVLYGDRRCLAKDGTWDYEAIPSERTEEWIAQHRFTRDEALTLAAEHAPNVKCNGKTAVELLEWLREQDDRVAGGGVR